MQYASLEVDGVTLRVPAGSMDPPTEFGRKTVDEIQHQRNWKLPTRKFVTTSLDEANEVGYALDWFMGGHEIDVDVQPEAIVFSVWSKGYYHHIGA